VAAMPRQRVLPIWKAGLLGIPVSASSSDLLAGGDAEREQIKKAGAGVTAGRLLVLKVSRQTQP